MKIYLDSCCYGRPFDNHSIPQTKAESDALTSIIKTCKDAGIKIIGSDAIISELGEIKKDDIRNAIEAHYTNTIDNSISLIESDGARAAELQTHNIGVMDSFHLAAAERGDVDFLLTTDTKFLNRVAKNNLSIVQIINPIDFLPEVVKWLQ